MRIMKDSREHPASRRSPVAAIAIVVAILVVVALTFGTLAGRQTNPRAPNGAAANPPPVASSAP